ncbi:hypothetical protein PAMP_017821 [Pampus punctatissimus]
MTTPDAERSWLAERNSAAHLSWETNALLRGTFLVVTHVAQAKESWARFEFMLGGGGSFQLSDSPSSHKQPGLEELERSLLPGSNEVQ